MKISVKYQYMCLCYHRYLAQRVQNYKTPYRTCSSVLASTLIADHLQQVSQKSSPTHLQYAVSKLGESSVGSAYVLCGLCFGSYRL